jgi:hypothetical protein
MVSEGESFTPTGFSEQGKVHYKLLDITMPTGRLTNINNP